MIFALVEAEKNIKNVVGQNMAKTAKIRRATIFRKTKETEIRMSLKIEGRGKGEISTSIFFLDHLLENFTRHGLFNLKIKAKGDLEVDQHHLVEDLGIVLGEAFKKALGKRKGINRAGYFIFPMDEALAVLAIDLSKRAYLNFDCQFRREKIGDLSSDLIKEFFWAFVRALEATVHIKVPYGENDHHKAEAIFKSFGKAMKMACSKEKRLKEEYPSTKGII